MSSVWSAEVIIECLFAVAMSRAGVQRVVSRGDNRLFVCCGYVKSWVQGVVSRGDNRLFVCCGYIKGWLSPACGQQR